jgi:hypothetical protein
MGRITNAPVANDIVSRLNLRTGEIPVPDFLAGWCRGSESIGTLLRSPFFADAVPCIVESVVCKLVDLLADICIVGIKDVVRAQAFDVVEVFGGAGGYNLKP